MYRYRMRINPYFIYTHMQRNIIFREITTNIKEMKDLMITIGRKASLSFRPTHILLYHQS